METNKLYRLIDPSLSFYDLVDLNRATERLPRDHQQIEEVWRPAAPLRHSIHVLTFATDCYINRGRTLRPPKDHLGIIAIDGRLVRDLICQCSSVDL